MSQSDLQHNLKHVFAKWESSRGSRSAARGGSSGDNYRNVVGAGKQAWKKRFGDVGPPPLRCSRQMRVPPVPRNANVPTTNLSFFKTSPLVMPSVGQSRPVMGRRCDCMPPPMKNDSFQHDGLIMNVLKCKKSKRGSTFLRRKLHDLCESLKSCTRYKYADFTQSILDSPRMLEAVQIHLLSKTSDTRSCSSELRRDERRIRVKVSRFLQRTSAVISASFMQFVCWVLRKLLGQSFRSVLVSRAQLDMIMEASKSDDPVIFLPLCPSHLDYFLLSFVIVSYGIRAPYVIVKEELFPPMLRYLFCRLGAIPYRKYDSDSSLRSKVQQMYITELLTRGENMVIFTGQLASPSSQSHNAALHSVMHALVTGGMHDAQLVPVNIGYEKTMALESNSLHQVEAPRPTFWSFLCSIWCIVRGRYGNVRVDFGRPFSLKEYVRTTQKGYRVMPSAGTQWEDDNTPVILSSEQEISVVESLSNHVLCDQLRNRSAMSTQLFAFLIINQHSNGTSLDELIASFDWLRSEILSRGHDLAFSGTTVDVVIYADDLLGCHLVEEKADSEENNNGSQPYSCLVRPVNPEDYEQLSCLAREITAIFVTDSIIANVIHMLIGSDHRPLTGHPEDSGTVKVSRKEIMSEAIQLCSLLQHEYIIKPPCTSLETVLTDAIARLVESDVMRPEETATYQTNQERAIAQRLSQTCTFDNDDSDEEYQELDTLYDVDVTSAYSCDRLRFLCRLIGPVLETCYVVACCFVCLLNADREKTEFTRFLQDILEQRQQRGLMSYPDRVCIRTLQNVLHAFEELHVIEANAVNDDLNVISLHDDYYSSSDLNRFIDSLERYRL